MRAWPPYSPDEDPWPPDGELEFIDQGYVDDEFDQLLVAYGLAVGPYSRLAEVEQELADLGALRHAYRHARWAITASRIVAAGAIVAWMWGGPAVLAVPAVGFTLLAVHLSHQPGVYPERGRELDADIADARERYRRLQRGEGW